MRLLLMLALVFAVAYCGPAVAPRTVRKCANESFACHSGRCIPRSWLCDGDVDCPGEEEEDEKGCENEAQERCASNEFRCKTPSKAKMFRQSHVSCILADWRCDGEFDCEDKSDEENCEDFKCKKGQFQCNHAGDGHYKLCIPDSWRCDGQTDCDGGVDEQGCENKTACEPHDHRCDNDICIFNNWVCDGEDDCGDGSDERNCNQTATEMCSSKEMFKCVNSDGCIPKQWKCDGEADCLDHSDERNCTTDKKFTCHHADREFACETGHTCISSLWKCDGEEDCADGSDERNCDNMPSTCPDGKRECPKPRGSNAVFCIAANAWCNGNEDCPDGSDEVNCTTKTDDKPCADNEWNCGGNQCVLLHKLCTSDKFGCGDDTTCNKNITMCSKGSAYCHCHNSYVTSNEVCHCGNGFRFDNTSKKCLDIDECKELVGICDQICTNMPGTYECSCHQGYKLSFQKLNNALSSSATRPTKCRAVGGDPLVLLSNRATIRQFDLVKNVHLPLIRSIGSAVAMDFHLKNGSIIWSDIALQKIFMCQIGNDSDSKHFVTKEKCEGKDRIELIGDDVHTPDGLAVDWIHNLLFWTDGGRDEINVMDLTTLKRHTLVNSKLEEPRAIAVDPEMGLIFWTDWGKNARIERAGMNGENRVTIVEGDRVKWPNGLALDYVDKRLFWADAKLKSIFSSDYWGKDVKVVLHSHHYLRHPFSLAVFEDRVYYTDWEHDGVMTLNKFTGEEVKKLMEHVETPMTVKIYHQQAQPQLENKCENSVCNQLCLPRATITGRSSAEEKNWYGRPYACLCEGTTPSTMIQCTIEEATAGASRGFSLSTLLFGMLIVIFAVTGAVYYRRRHAPGAFTALNFDNPIYRRTVEAEMDDPFRDPFHDDGAGASERQNNSRLVIGVPSSTADPEADLHNGSGNGTVKT